MQIRPSTQVHHNWQHQDNINTSRPADFKQFADLPSSNMVVGFFW